jgi:hypothetical protein
MSPASLGQKAQLQVHVVPAFAANPELAFDIQPD